MSLNLVFKGAAWQMIEKLCRTNKPDFDILRRTLVVCSEHLEEPDIAAQVTVIMHQILLNVTFVELRKSQN